MKTNLKKLLALTAVVAVANSAVVVAANNSQPKEDGYVTKGKNWVLDHKTATGLGAAAVVLGVTGAVLHRQAKTRGVSNKYVKMAYIAAAICAAAAGAEVAFDLTGKAGFDFKVNKLAKAIEKAEKATGADKTKAQEAVDAALKALNETVKENKFPAAEYRAFKRLKEGAARTAILAQVPTIEVAA